MRTEIQPLTNLLTYLFTYVFAVIVFTARRSYTSAVLEVVILSVSLSVRLFAGLSHACNVTQSNNALRIF